MASHAQLGWSLRRVGYSDTVHHLPHDRDTVTVGRLSGDIICPGSTISRFHSRLVYTENTWHVVDLKSINGVHVKSVNGTSRRLAPNSLTPLNAGDFITFGCENVKSEDRFIFELCRNLQNGSASNNSSLAGTVVESTSSSPETTVVEEVNVASLNFDNLDHTVSVRASCLLDEISSEDLKIPEETNGASKNATSLANSSLTSSSTGTFSVERISLGSVIPNAKECRVVLEDIGPFLKNQTSISYKLFMERAKQKRGLQSILKKKRSKRYNRILWTSDEESDSETGTVSSCINPSKRSKRRCLSEDNDGEQPFPGPSWGTEDANYNQTTKTKASSYLARQFESNAKVDGSSKYRKKYADGSRMRSQEKRCASIGFDISSPTNSSQSDFDDRVPSTSPHPQSGVEFIDLAADEKEQALIAQNRVMEASSEELTERVDSVHRATVKNVSVMSTTSVEPSDESVSNEDEDSKLARLCQTIRYKHRTTILTNAIPSDPEGRHRRRLDSSICGDKAVENRDPNSCKKKDSSELISRRLKVAKMFSQSYSNGGNMKARNKGSRRRELQLKLIPSGYIASTKNAKAKVNNVNVPKPPKFSNLSSSKIAKGKLARDKVVNISIQTVVEKSAAPTKVKVTPKSRNCLLAEDLGKELPVSPKKKRVLVEADVFSADLQSKIAKKNKEHRKLKTPEVDKNHLTEKRNEQNFPTEIPSSNQEDQIEASMGQVSKKKTSKRVSFSDKNDIRFFEPSREIYPPSESRESEVVSKESASEAIPAEMYSSVPKKRISLSEYRKSAPSRASSEQDSVTPVIHHSGEYRQKLSGWTGRTSVYKSSHLPFNLQT